MEGSALANPPAGRRQASGADTALSNAVTSMTVSQQESEGQASEPAAGSTGEPPSPRAARSQVSTAVSFEGARAAGSAVQPERSVDEDSALSAAEPDGPIRSNRLQQVPRPANSLISTAVHPTMRNSNTNNVGKYYHLAPPQQQQHPPAPQHAAQQHAPTTAPNHPAHGRGAAINTDRYASSPEVQRPHSITSQAAETRGEAHGHGGRGVAHHAPGHGPRTQPSRSHARGTTPASVYGQLKVPGVGNGGSTPRKGRQHNLHWAIGVAGGGSSGTPVMDNAAAAAAAAAAFLGNGFVGSWGLMQGLGQGTPAGSPKQAAIPHSLLAAAAAAAAGPSGNAVQGALPLPTSPFNLATLGQLQLQAAGMQHQAVVASVAVGDMGAGPGLIWHPPDAAVASNALGGQPAAPTVQTHSSQLPAQHALLLPPPHPAPMGQSLQPANQQMPLQQQASAAAAAGVACSTTQKSGAGGDEEGLPDSGKTAAGGEAIAAGGGGFANMDFSELLIPAAQQPAEPPGAWGTGAGAGITAGPPYGLPAAMIGAAYGGAGGGAQFGLQGMQGLQGLLISAAAAAAAGNGAAGGGGGVATSGTGGANTDGGAGETDAVVRTRIRQRQQHRAHEQHPTARLYAAPMHPRDLARHEHHRPMLPSEQASLQGHSQASGAATAGTGAPAPALDRSSMPGVAAATAEMSGGVAGGSSSGDLGAGAANPPHPAMHLYLPVVLPLHFVNAQMALNQAVANMGDVGPTALAPAGAAEISAAAASTHALNTSRQHSPGSPESDLESGLQQAAARTSAGAISGSGGGAGGGGGRQHVLLGAAASVAGSMDGGRVGGGGEQSIRLDGGGEHASGVLSSGFGAPAEETVGTAAADDAAGGLDAAAGGGGDGHVLSQHSSRSAPSPGGSGAMGAGLTTGMMQAAGLAGPVASEAGTGAASVAAAGGGAAGGILPPAGDMAGVGPAAAAQGGGGVVLGALPGHLDDALHLHHHQVNSNPLNNVNANSNAYGAGPSMTQTADYRSQLQVALSLLLQATSVAYNSQRQSGIAGANEGSGIFAAPGQQASVSGAADHDLSDGVASGLGGVGGGMGGVGTGGGSHAGGGAAGLGIVGSGGGGIAASGSGAGAVAGGGGGHMVPADHIAAGEAGLAQSLHGARIGPAAAVAEPMDTDGQVVSQAMATSPVGMDGRDADARPLLGGAGEAAGGADGGATAYQAPQWSTQRGGGAAGGGGARSAMYGSSGGCAAAAAGRGSNLHGVPLAHGHTPVAHHHNHSHSHHHYHSSPHAHATSYHHRASGAGLAACGDPAVGNDAAMREGCSPAVAELAGANLPGVVDGAAGGVVGASVGSAGGGEQADNNWALQLDGEAGHPAASVHATVIAEGSDASEEGGGGDDSGSMEVEVPPAAPRGLDAGGGAAGGGVGSSKAAVEVRGEVVNQRSEGSRSQSREGQASKQQPPHELLGLLLQGPPAAGIGGLGGVASHQAEARSPLRLPAAPDPRDSSMGMAAGPSHDGTRSGSNGATTSDTVDMADDSGMGSASQHDVDSGMSGDPQDIMQTGENLLTLDEQGGENAGGVGGGVEDVEERGDDNDNAGSADGGEDRGGGGVGADDGELDGEGGARTSVGPAAALLGMLGGGGGGGVSTGHMMPQEASGGKDLTADKAASYHPGTHKRDAGPRHHGHHATHPEPLSAAGGGGNGSAGGTGVRASNSGTTRPHHIHPLQQHPYQLHNRTARSLYGATAAAAAAADGAVAGGGIGPSSAGGPRDGRGAPRDGGLLPDCGSPAPQPAPRLAAANSTAISPLQERLGSPRRLGGVDEGQAGRVASRATGAHAHPHWGGHERRSFGGEGRGEDGGGGAGPALSASNAERSMQQGGPHAGDLDLSGSQAFHNAAATPKQTAAAADGAVGGGSAAAAATDAVMKSSSQEAAGSVGHQQHPQKAHQQATPHPQHPPHRQQHQSDTRPSYQGAQQHRDASYSHAAHHAHHHHSQSPRPWHDATGAAANSNHNHHHHNNNTTLAALGLPALHPTSVLTTASQPPPPQSPPQMQLAAEAVSRHDGSAEAAVGDGGSQPTATPMTHGSAGGGRHGAFEPRHRVSPDAVPQVTEIHGAFGGTAATAAEAIAQQHHQHPHPEHLQSPSAEHVGGDAAAGTAADEQGSWQQPWPERRTGGGGAHGWGGCSGTGGRTLSAVMPQFTEVHGAFAFARTAGTAAEAQAAGLLSEGGGGGGDGPGGLDFGCSEGGGGGSHAGGTLVRSRNAVQQPADTLNHASPDGGNGSDGGAEGPAAGRRESGNAVAGPSRAKAQSALLPSSASEGLSCGGIEPGGALQRSGRTRGGGGAHDGTPLAPPSAAGHHRGGGNGGGTPASAGGAGSNGVVRTLYDSHAARGGHHHAAGPNSRAASGAAAAAEPDEAAQVSYLNGSVPQRNPADGPTVSRAASGGGAADGVRRRRTHGMGRTAPSRGTQQQPAVHDDGELGGVGSGPHMTPAHVADAPLSTQANAYGGYDDENDSDGERLRAEGPPQPQMTILVTSHAANSHHTVSGGTAVVSEADNGGTVGDAAGGDRADGRGANSPALAAWEEELDGPPSSQGADALQPQGSWRGGAATGGGRCGSVRRGSGGGGGGTISAVMSSGGMEDGGAVNQAPVGHLWHLHHHQQTQSSLQQEQQQQFHLLQLQQHHHQQHSARKVPRRADASSTGQDAVMEVEGGWGAAAAGGSSAGGGGGGRSEGGRAGSGPTGGRGRNRGEKRKRGRAALGNEEEDDNGEGGGGTQAEKPDDC